MRGEGRGVFGQSHTPVWECGGARARIVFLVPTIRRWGQPSPRFQVRRGLVC